MTQCATCFSNDPANVDVCDTCKPTADFTTVKTIDLTPDADGYAAIGATFVAAVLGDVKRPRQDASLHLLTSIVDIAFEFGRATQEAVTRRNPGPGHEEAAEGKRLRDALFARVGGPKR